MDKLLEKAFAYKKTKLWKKIYDDQLIVIEHSDGSVGYCCIMGMQGNHIGISVYPGTDGLNSMRRFHNLSRSLSQPEELEYMMSQDCVSCSFECKDYLSDEEIKEVREFCKANSIKLAGSNAWPKFERLATNCVPWYLCDDVGKEHLGEALDVCMALSAKIKSGEKIDFESLEGIAPGQQSLCAKIDKDGNVSWSTAPLPEYSPISYRTDVKYDAKQASRVLKSKKRTGKWLSDVILTPFPTKDKTEKKSYYETVPYYPFVCLTMSTDGTIISGKISQSKDLYQEDFVNNILKDMLENGKPSEIIVMNDRTYSMFLNITEYLGIELTQEEFCEELAAAEEDMYDHFKGELDDDDHEESEEPELSDKELKQLSAIVNAIDDFTGYDINELLYLNIVVSDYPEHFSPKQRSKLLKAIQKKIGESL